MPYSLLSFSHHQSQHKTTCLSLRIGRAFSLEPLFHSHNKCATNVCRNHKKWKRKGWTWWGIWAKSFKPESMRSNTWKKSHRNPMNIKIWVGFLPKYSLRKKTQHLKQLLCFNIDDTRHYEQLIEFFLLPCNSLIGNNTWNHMQVQSLQGRMLLGVCRSW